MWHFLAHPTVCCIHCAVRIFEMAGSHMPSFALERARDRARAFLHRRKPKTPRTEKPWAAPACFPPVEANPSKEFQILYKPKQTWHQVKAFMLKHGYKIYRTARTCRDRIWLSGPMWAIGQVSRESTKVPVRSSLASCALWSQFLCKPSHPFLVLFFIF